jgi:predicted peptidase
MRMLAALCLCLALLASRADAAGTRDLSMRLSDGTDLPYGLSVPDGYKSDQPRPLILALHPGGERMRYYGSAYARVVVEPAVGELGALIVAPDCPSAAWTDAAAESAVMQLLKRVMRDYSIDSKRVLVLGFSIGGRGTWFMASHHPDIFTGAIPMAASTGDEAIETLATMPTYIIHSRRDQVMPFGPAEKRALDLKRLGRVVQFEALSEPTHFEMDAYMPALRRGIAWVAAQWSAGR